MLKVFAFYDKSWKDRPREDYFKYDLKKGIFVVADGVGLWEGIEYQGLYPKISGSGKLAKLFCEAFIAYYKRHVRVSIPDAFSFANKSAAYVNRTRSKYTAFRKHKNLFAATGAMVHINANQMKWGRICDSHVAVIGENGSIKRWPYIRRHRFPWPGDSDKYATTDWTFFARTLVRNAIGRNGKLLGYGVITGEAEAVRYLETRMYRLHKGDIVFLFTDGFEPYVRSPDFRKLFLRWDNNQKLKKDVKSFIDDKTKELKQLVSKKEMNLRLPYDVLVAAAKKVLGTRYKDVPWADEKTLIAIKID